MKTFECFFFFSVYPIWCSFLYYLPFSWMYSEMFPHDGTEKREPWTTATRHAKVERKDSWINIYLKREKKKLKFPFRILFFSSFLPSFLSLPDWTASNGDWPTADGWWWMDKHDSRVSLYFSLSQPVETTATR